jgi:hypothetical protein
MNTIKKTYKQIHDSKTGKVSDKLGARTIKGTEAIVIDFSR